MGRRFQLSLVAVGVIAAALLVSRAAQAEPLAQPERDTYVVAVQDNVFRPRMTTVEVGSSVTWLNEGSNDHTATSDSDVWDSETLSAGDDFAFTFEEPGIYTYFCQFHRARGMVGTVVVLAPEGGADGGDDASAPMTEGAPGPMTDDAGAYPPPVAVTEGQDADDATEDESEMERAPAYGAAEPGEARGDDGMAQEAPDGYDDTDSRDGYGDGDSGMPRDHDGYDDAGDGYYVVRPGDTLSGIAMRLGVPLMSLAYANGIYNLDYVRFGEVLAIPGHYGEYSGMNGYGSGSSTPSYGGYDGGYGHGWDSGYSYAPYNYGGYGYYPYAYGMSYGWPYGGYGQTKPNYGHGYGYNKSGYGSGYTNPGYGNGYNKSGYGYGYTKPAYGGGYTQPNYGYGYAKQGYGFGWAKQAYGHLYGWPYKR